MIDESNGALYLASVLDYGRRQEYNLRVVQHSMTDDSRMESFSLVEVVDENNHTPEFSYKMVVWNVSEDTPIGIEHTTMLPILSQIGSVIGQVEALDSDEGVNGSVSYRLLNYESVFKINLSTGEISLARALSFSQVTFSTAALCTFPYHCSSRSTLCKSELRTLLITLPRDDGPTASC